VRVLCAAWGEDCLDATEEQSGDFAKAAAALQAAQLAASDMDCSSGSCVVFSGEAMECKKAVGGIVNCCTTPDGISLADYISLVFAVGKLDNALMGLDKGNALRGSWETLRDPLVDTWSAVTERFTSVANNLMGKTAADATDAAARLSLDAFKQALMQETARWVSEIFGEAAANALFTVNGGAAFIGGNLQAGTIQLGGLVGTALSWVMTAYMIYTIAVILIQLIWTCEQEEFELGAKRELRSCHNVGSYCKTEVLFACIERRKAYCCFNTPLARILNEQIRPQLGRGWGEADSPDCTGLAVNHLGRIDWSRVNLDEWLAILAETGHFPTLDSLTIMGRAEPPRMMKCRLAPDRSLTPTLSQRARERWCCANFIVNLDALTGTGSALDLSGTRPDAAARSQKRSDGLDSDAARRDAEGELWGITLPALP
jgi:conjugal transfer mating pair stabilization protein TraN